MSSQTHDKKLTQRGRNVRLTKNHSKPKVAHSSNPRDSKRKTSSLSGGLDEVKNNEGKDRATNIKSEENINVPS
jgi:hypothetical protein